MKRRRRKRKQGQRKSLVPLGNTQSIGWGQRQRFDGLKMALRFPDNQLTRQKFNWTFCAGTVGITIGGVTLLNAINTPGLEFL